MLLVLLHIAVVMLLNKHSYPLHSNTGMNMAYCCVGSSNFGFTHTVWLTINVLTVRERVHLPCSTLLIYTKLIHHPAYLKKHLIYLRENVLDKKKMIPLLVHV